MKHIAFILVLLCSTAFTIAQVRQVIVHPEETDEILANPGMGWETFHRTSKQDKSLPPWIPSTIYYARWGWGQFEPQPGKIDEEFLDGTLKLAHDAGQKLAFRVMCCSTSNGQPYQPKWLKDVGGREIDADYSGGGPYSVPDLDDPIVLGRHLDFIKRLGQRYDGHPDIDHVDIGTVGWWGEWHMSGSTAGKMPTLANQKKIIDAYLAAFKKTPLVMLIGGKESLTYATGLGTGWRADCLGDMGGFSKNWCHMRKGYPVYIKEARIEDTWKTAPVAWETCWDMRKWVAEGWPLRFIFNYALACHGSIINNKSAPLPEGLSAAGALTGGSPSASGGTGGTNADNVRPELERFLRRLGYRLVLKELAHPAQVKPGEALTLAMKWQNTGSAPCYRPYRLAYRLTSTPAGAARPLVLPSEVAVNRWLPGSIPLFTDEFFKEPKDLPPGDVVNVSDAVKLPADLPEGTYELSIGVVEPSRTAPVVRLGIKGRDKDGWYPVSRLEIR